MEPYITSLIHLAVILLLQGAKLKEITYNKEKSNFSYVFEPDIDTNNFVLLFDKTFEILKKMGKDQVKSSDLKPKLEPKPSTDPFADLHQEYKKMNRLPIGAPRSKTRGVFKQY